MTEDPLDLIARGNATPGPFVRGTLIRLPGIEAEREDNYREIRTWQLRPEIFFEHECDDMKAAREIDNPASIAWRFDVYHKVSVVGPPSEWIYLQQGSCEPRDRAKGGRVVGIPSQGMMKVTLDRYGWVKHTGEPIYDGVQLRREKNYRRLLRPEFDDRGNVRAIHSFIKSEPAYSLVA